MIRAFPLCLEGGEDFASRKAMHLEATRGLLPTLTPEFAMDPRTGLPRFRLRSSVKVPGPKKGPLVDSSGKLTGKVGFMDAASGASRRMRFQEKLDAKRRLCTTSIRRRPSYGTRPSRRSGRSLTPGRHRRDVVRV